ESLSSAYETFLACPAGVPPWSGGVASPAGAGSPTPEGTPPCPGTVPPNPGTITPLTNGRVFPCAGADPPVPGGSPPPWPGGEPPCPGGGMNGPRPGGLVALMVTFPPRMILEAGRAPVSSTTLAPSALAMLLPHEAVIPLEPKVIWPPFARLIVRLAGSGPLTGFAGTGPITTYTLPRKSDTAEEAVSVAPEPVDIELARSLFCSLMFPSVELMTAPGATVKA